MAEPTKADGGLLEIPLSALEHFDYCRRQAALIHIEGIWAESAETVRGDLSHTTVDLPGLRRRKGLTVVRSLPVWSHQHGLRGICDVVEFQGGVAAPVEYKVGRRYASGPAEVQLGGQALCLIESGFDVPVGYLYSVAERRRHPVEIDAALLDRTIETVNALRQVLTSRALPVARNDSRCRRCSLIDDCLPEVTDGRATAAVDIFTPRPLGRWHD